MSSREDLIDSRLGSCASTSSTSSRVLFLANYLQLIIVDHIYGGTFLSQLDSTTTLKPSEVALAGQPALWFLHLQILVPSYKLKVLSSSFLLGLSCLDEMSAC